MKHVEPQDEQEDTETFWSVMLPFFGIIGIIWAALSLLGWIFNIGQMRIFY